MSTVVETINLGRYEGFQNREEFFALFNPLMIAEARRAARTRARSWRGLHVGACAALLVSDYEEALLLADANNSPNEGAPKDCAEMGILRETDSYREAFGDCTLLGLCVAGPDDLAQIESVNRLRAPTLHPCPDCRLLLQEHPAVTPDLPIVSCGLSGPAVERYTLAELLLRYEGITPLLTSRQALQLA